MMLCSVYYSKYNTVRILVIIMMLSVAIIAVHYFQYRPTLPYGYVRVCLAALDYHVLAYTWNITQIF